jgi:hypothetical protein
MSRKITLSINGSRFDIDLEDEFYGYMEKELENNFNVLGNNDVKVLLQAYIKKNYEIFEAKEKLDEISSRLN